MDEKPTTKDLGTFYCPGKRPDHQKHVWQTTEWVETEEGQFADCPICGKATRRGDVRLMNVYKAWQNQTGPRTPAGKRRASLNNYRHGMYAQTYHVLAPALTGKFPECGACEYRTPCKEEPYTWCPVRLEPMMRIVKAFQEGDLKDMREFAGLNQAKMFSVVQQMFQEIQAKGVMIPIVKETEDEDGKITREVTGYKPNPLLSRIPEYMGVLGHTADQQVMTPKAQEEEEAVQGFLQQGEKAIDMSEAIAERNKALLQLKQQIARAHIRSENDPALKRYRRELENAEEITPKEPGGEA